MHEATESTQASTRTGDCTFAELREIASPRSRRPTLRGFALRIVPDHPTASAIVLASHRPRPANQSPDRSLRNWDRTSRGVHGRSEHPTPFDPLGRCQKLASIPRNLGQRVEFEVWASVVVVGWLDDTTALRFRRGSAFTSVVSGSRIVRIPVPVAASSAYRFRPLAGYADWTETSRIRDGIDMSPGDKIDSDRMVFCFCC
jgi:hypothetical protein